MGSSQATRTWLRQNIQPYSAHDRLYADIDALLLAYPSLRPKTDIYTYDDGRQQLLLCIHGLLPIVYRAAPYNIPIAVWIPFEFPRSPPIAYVVPNTDMLLRSSHHLERSGRTDLPYQQHWLRKSDGCSIRAFVESMQEHFSREPPLYAKPSTHQQQPPDLQPRPSPPTLPDNRPPLAAPPHSAQSFSSGRPLVPPKPGSQIPSHHAATPVQSPPSLQESQVLANQPPPPPPGTRPLQAPSPVPPYIHAHQRSSSTSLSFSPSAAAASAGAPATPGSPNHRWSTPPQGYTSYAPQTPPPPFHTTQSSQPRHASSPPYQIASPPPAPAPVHSALVPTYQQSAQSPPVHRGQFSHSSLPPGPPTHLTSSPPVQQWTPPTAIVAPPPVVVPVLPPRNLLEDDDDSISESTSVASIPHTPAAGPPPPRPPNPELLALHSTIHSKFHASLAALSQTLASDTHRLQVTQRDLLAGEPAIRDEMARLEAVRDVCRTVSSRIRTVVTEADGRLSEVRRKGEVEVDELVCSTTIVYNQLFNLVAEDNAIEDTIYHLHRALNAGRIDLERFLRSTRALAEEQFMKRALVEKISNNIPMGAST